MNIAEALLLYLNCRINVLELNLLVIAVVTM